MYYLEVRSKRGVFVSKRMIAMRGGSQNLLDTMAFEGFNIGLRQPLERSLPSYLAHALPAAIFFGAQNSKINAGLMEDPCCG